MEVDVLDRRDIARLFMTHYSDRAWDDPAGERARIEREVVSEGVCGYCVFGGELERTRRLNREMTEVAGRTLLVASDLEQGLGQQVRGGTVFPSQMAVGAASASGLEGGSSFADGAKPGSESGGGRSSPGALAGRVARAVGREAAAVGVNVVLAPVADLATEPANPIIDVRSYGASPERAAVLVAAAVSGLQAAGVAATAKHFPGHGDTSVDSHIDLPVVTADRATLERRELPPFRAAIGAGARLVMTGHLAFPALTGDETPATLAPEVGEALLREELGFDGVVITDAMLMGGVAKRFGPAEASVRAILAGADIVLMPSDLEAALDGVAAAVASGRLADERVIRSLERMDDLLSWLETSAPASGAAADTPSDEVLSEHARLAAEVAARAVTLVSEDPRRAPATERSAPARVALAALVDAERPPDLRVLTSWAEERPGADALRVVSERTGARELQEIDRSAAGSEAFFLFVFDQPAAWKGRTGFAGELANWADHVLAAAPSSAAAVFAGPRLLDAFPGAGRLLCCYDGSPAMQEAALHVLFDSAVATGTLPAPRVR